MPCPARDLRRCRCESENLPMMFNKHSAFYPRSGLWQLGSQHLFDVTHLEGFGRHFWEMVVYNAKYPCFRSVEFLPNHDSFFLNLHLPYNIFMGVTLQHRFSGKNGVDHIVLLQRAVRLFLFRRRVLALMMGLHPRLGESSAIASVPADLLEEEVVHSYVASHHKWTTSSPS
jgi:hypothetical protein